MEKEITIQYDSKTWGELTEADKLLVEKAKEATKNSYAPFSQFHVGCAVELEDGTILTGNNQENASYPCGTCAERATIFYAHANYPHLAPINMAIAATQKEGKFTCAPVPPCGACRQALLEMEQIYKRPLRIILYGEKNSFIIPSITNLLPFQFEAEMME